MRATQDPPQQVVDDCTKEVDEALRQAETHIKLDTQQHFIFILESSAKAVFSSI